MRAYIILLLLVIIAYANSLQNEFVWDEAALIVNNPRIDLPIKEIPSLLIKPLWDIPSFGEEYPQIYYRPILSAFYVLNYKVWGLNPSGFHFSNILLHLISAMVLYRIGLIFFNDILISLIGASIFAVHPIHNESAGRAASGEVLFGFFIILSIYFFLKEKRYISWITFFFALLSKETSVMLPFALVILAINKQGLKKGIIEIIPYLMLIGAYLLMRLMFVDVVFGEKVAQPVFTRIFTMAVAAFDYTRLLIIPYPLKPFYTARWHTSIFEPKVIFSIIVLALLSFLAFKIRKDRAALFLLLFPFIMLAPVIWRVNAFVAGADLVYIAERYLYAPVMLFSLFASAFISRLADDKIKKYLNIGWIFIILLFMLITISSNTTWKDNITINKTITEKSPDAAFAHNNLGNAYASEGMLDEARIEYLIALRLNPASANSHNNLGNIYYSMSILKKAMEEFTTALTIDPYHIDAHNNLGNIYNDIGMFDEAMKEYLTVIKLNPEYMRTHYNLGVIHQRQGRIDEAIKEYRIALKLNPYHPDAHYNLGIAYANKGMLDEAIYEYMAALRLKPDDIDAHYNLGNAYKQKGLIEKAKKEFETILKLKPNNPQILDAVELLNKKHDKGR